MKVNYNWLRDYLGDALPPAEEVADLLTEHAFEIEGIESADGQTVIDVDVLPNRSSDCLCHRGIARELATILGVELEQDPLVSIPALPQLPDGHAVTVNVSDTDACPRFTASLITDVSVAPSPNWLRERLESLGQRSINNVVDATNYVMLAMGQPLHAYDADLFPQVDGAWQFGVRFADEGETVEILPEGGATEPRTVECRGTELLIVDESSNTPIGLAGVKGGQFAGVHEGTTRIIVEAAHFDPVITRKTARRLGIVIDASKRFENEPSRELPLYAQHEISQLISEIAGGTYAGTVDEYFTQKPNPQVSVRVSRANALLGLDLSQEQVKDIIVRTGAAVTVSDADVLLCTGPFERTDLQIEVDFIEEVGRLHGLSNIVSVPPTVGSAAPVHARQYYSERVRGVLLQEGASEVITSSFQKKDNIQLRNALASDKSYVRSTLSKNMTQVLDVNFTHGDVLGMSRIAAFEIGTVFDSKIAEEQKTVDEHTSLCIGLRTKGSGYTPKDDAPLQQLCDEVSDSLGVSIEWNIEKGVAECDFDSIIADLSVPETYDAFAKPAAKTFTPVSPYPAVARDIALWVSEGVGTAEVATVLRMQSGDLLHRLDQFDEFTKDGRTSYAFRLVFLSHKKTLTAGEVDTIMDRVTAAVSEKGWKVR